MTVKYDFVVNEGVAYNRMVRRNVPRVDVNGDPVRDANNKIVYDPLDMTGWIAHMMVRPDFDRPPVIDVNEVDAGNGWIELGNGFFSIHLTGAQTALINNGYVYDILIGSIPSTFSPVMSGTVKVNRMATR